MIHMQDKELLNIDLRHFAESMKAVGFDLCSEYDIDSKDIHTIANGLYKRVYPLTITHLLYAHQDLIKRGLYNPELDVIDCNIT